MNKAQSTIATVACIWLFLTLATVVDCFAQSTLKTVPFLTSWQLLGRYVENDNLLYASIKITNQRKQILGNSGWAFYFNRHPSYILPESVSRNVHLDRISGGFFRITPTKEFRPLKQGETATVLYGSNHPLAKTTDGPSGGYFVFEESEEAIASNIRLLPPAVDVITLTGFQDWIVTPEQRYKSNEQIAEAQIDNCPITPTPASYKKSDGEFTLTDQTIMRCSRDMAGLASRFKAELTKLSAVEVSLMDDAAVPRKPLLRSIELYLDPNALAESYELKVTPQGIIIVGDKAGIFYATRTLIGLARDADATKFSCCTIKDAPRFGYRGLHVDVARNFHSKQNMMKIIEQLSFYKMNKLHLHLCDDEGWRVEIAGLPELTEIGGRRGHTLDESDRLFPAQGSGPVVGENPAGTGFYSRDDFIEILKYATDRHIEVIPEIDFPGHARAAIVAMKRRYDRLMNTGDETAANEFLLTDPDDQSEYWSIQYYNDNVVCAAQSGVVRFFAAVVDDMKAMYDKAGAKLSIVHTGGDEVPAGVWQKSPMCQKFIADHDDVNDVADLSYVFLGKLSNVLEQRGLQMAGWEEIALKANYHDGHGEKVPNPDFVDRNFIPYIWNSIVGGRGEELGYRLANAGYPVVLCNADHLYLSLSPEIDTNEPGNYWAGILTLKSIFEFTPLDIYKVARTKSNGSRVDRANVFANATRLTDVGRENILGIQACLWSESLRNEALLMDRLFPKLLPVAQRAWSQQPEFAKTNDLEKLDAARDEAFAKFSNRIDRYELSRLTRNNIGYHLPEPGVLRSGGQIMANIQFPTNLKIRYTRDGSQPTTSSPAFQDPLVAKPGKYRFATFATDGRSSGGVTIEVE